MAQVIEMNISNGSKILVEVAPVTGENKRGLDVVSKMDEAFDKAVQNIIVQNSLILVNAFKEMESHPLPLNKATAEFGIKITGKGNVYVVEASTEASFKITLEWLPSGKK